MPIMDGLAATMKLRAHEAEMDQDRKNSETRIRIPIVGLSADIQLSTKEVCITLTLYRPWELLGRNDHPILQTCLSFLTFSSRVSVQAWMNT